MVASLKIDRSKLNTILRSGLNPEIKTRKQLATYLSLDPTSITRWFSTRDRLGNPRYPVVPDRHVTKILQLFNLDPQSLSLDDDEFRQYCFEQSLLQINHQNDLEEKNKARLAKALERQLTISDYATPKRGIRSQAAVLSLVILVAAVWYFTKPLYISDSEPKVSVAGKHKALNELECWTGYSSSLGDFKGEDVSDPCHYRKLFHRALIRLKAENESFNSLDTRDGSSGTHSYISFLFEQLENRRIRESIALNIELGKSEMYRKNYIAAQNHFDNASELLMKLPEHLPELSNEISIHTSKIAIQID